MLEQHLILSLARKDRDKASPPDSLLDFLGKLKVADLQVGAGNVQNAVAVA